VGILQMTSRRTFVAVTVTYNSGSGTETVPLGARNCVITLWGGGGGGGAGSPGTGGCGGGYCKKTVTVTGGQTFSYAVGAAGNGSIAAPTAGGNSTVTSAAPSVNLAGNGGGAAGGAGGTASGGDTNTSGTAGSLGVGGQAGGYPTDPTSGAPNSANNGSAGNAVGGGGASNTAGVAGGNGAAGRITFAYTP